MTDHQVNEAQFQVESLRRALEDLRQQVYAQVKSSYLDWQSSLARIHRAQQAVEASNVELELADKRYQTGLGSIIELTDAQRQYTDDAAQYVDALYGFALAQAAVEHASACCAPRL